MLDGLLRLLGGGGKFPTTTPQAPAPAPSLSALHRLIFNTPDQQLNKSPYPMLNRGIAFNGRLPNPNVHGVPLLNGNLGNDWQFYSNSANANAPGWLENNQGQRIPYGGQSSTFDAPIIKPAVNRPVVALPQYLPQAKPIPRTTI